MTVFPSLLLSVGTGVLATGLWFGWGKRLPSSFVEHWQASISVGLTAGIVVSMLTMPPFDHPPDRASSPRMVTPR